MTVKSLTSFCKLSFLTHHRKNLEMIRICGRHEASVNSNIPAI